MIGRVGCTRRRAVSCVIGGRWRWSSSPELVVDEIGQRGLFDALTDGPFLTDVVLHEEGVFGEFLAARDGLLPEDEALLAAQWALVDRGVFEVLETTGTQLELRDVARGDRIRVVNTHPSDRTRAGMLLFGRPTPGR